MGILSSMKEQLQAWMDKKGLSQLQGAQRLGVSASVLCMWLQGKRKPNRVNMQKLAQIVKINPRDML